MLTEANTQRLPIITNPHQPNIQPLPALPTMPTLSQPSPKSLSPSPTSPNSNPLPKRKFLKYRNKLYSIHPNPTEPSNQTNKTINQNSNSLKKLSLKNSMFLSSTKRNKIIINPDIDYISKLSLDENSEETYRKIIAFTKKKEFIESKINKRKEEIKNNSVKTLQNNKETLAKIEAKEIEKKNENKLRDYTNKINSKKEEVKGIIGKLLELNKENDNIKFQLELMSDFSRYVNRKVNYKYSRKRGCSGSMSHDANDGDNKNNLNVDSNNNNHEETNNNNNNVRNDDNNNNVFNSVDNEENSEIKSKRIKEKEEKIKSKFNKVSIFEQKEETKRAYFERIKEIKNEIKVYTTRKYEAIEELRKIKKEKSILTQELYDFYHLALYEGTDFRGDGLMYLIKNIWNIGMDVDISYMPEYLDKQSIDYLFTATRKNLDLANVKALIEEEKYKFAIAVQKEEEENKSNNIVNNNNMGNNGNNNILIKNDDKINEENKDSVSDGDSDEIDIDEEPKNDFFQTGLKENKKIFVFERYPYTKKFLEKYEKHNIKNEENINLKDACTMMEKRKKFSQALIAHYNNLEKLKMIYKQMELNYEEDRKKEVDRIFKEFLCNDYAKKYNTNIETVLAAICGNEGKNNEMVNYNKMMKMDYEQKRKCRFYSTFKGEKHT